MKGKAPDFIPEYSYEKLGEILQDATLKANTGKLKIEDKLYGIAAGYNRKCEKRYLLFFNQTGCL